jgi:hypothetical protein
MLRPLVVAICLLRFVVPAPARAADLPAGRLQRLLDLLTDRDYRVRLQAAIALGQVRDTRTVPALIRRLDDPNALVRGMVAAALGEIGDSRASTPLRERLKDKDSLVRRHARASLEQIQKASKAPDGRATSNGRTILLRLGGVGDRTRQGQVLIPELRRLWTERISQTPGIRLVSGSANSPGQKVYEVNASITQLSSHHRGDLVETTCSVSVVVGDHHGSILMMTSGGATVQVQSQTFSKSQEPALRASALANAVASAHSNVVKFLAAR